MADCACLRFYATQPSIFDCGNDDELWLRRFSEENLEKAQQEQATDKLRNGRPHMLEEFDKVLEMYFQDASYAANLARQGCMKLFKLRAADEISPIQDFNQLSVLGEHSSDEGPAYAVKMFDRLLCLKPATYPARRMKGPSSSEGLANGTLKQYWGIGGPENGYEA